MSPVPLYETHHSFYVPHFDVKVEGTKLENDVIRDVAQVTYKDSVNEIDSFELTVNNWDAKKIAFKYEPASEAAFREIFDPGRKLELFMGYFDNAPSMMKGEITTLEPDYPEGGSPTLKVRGLNVLHRFRSKQHTWSWDKAKDSAIAEEIGRTKPSDDRPGIGFPVRINTDALKAEHEENVFMNNQFDIVFLMQRARRLGYSLFIGKEGEKEFLHFGPPAKVAPVEYELEWGKSLSSFRPTLTTANQVAKVTVVGWDRKTRRAISESAAFPKDSKINADQTAVAAVVKAEEVISDPPARSKDEALKLAKKRLNELRRGMIRATGTTVGLPLLRAGSNVRIKLGGSRFDGRYFVTSTTHTIGSGGYRTTFEAHREEEG
jgi:phage protein D